MKPVKRAYLNILFESLPGSTPVVVARQAAIHSSSASLLTVSTGIWATILECEADTFQEARDRIMSVVGKSKQLRPLLVWLDESLEAHNARGVFQRLSR